MPLRHASLAAAVAVFAAALACDSGTAHAEVPSFVADAVQAAPGMEPRNGKLYVGRLGTRFEFTESKQRVIQIIQPHKGLFRLLFPDTKTYMEMQGPASTLVNGERPTDPCRPSAEIDCRKEADETIGDIAVERWVAGPKGGQQAVTIWWDRVRRMPLRQTFPDGGSARAEMTGAIDFEGRKVEQWKMAMTPKGGQEQFSFMLFAPDLGIPVMEQGATGLVKELHNIALTTPDPALYEVPAGYQKVTPPAAAQPQPAR